MVYADISDIKSIQAKVDIKSKQKPDESYIVELWDGRVIPITLREFDYFMGVFARRTI